ncbi:MAG: hypothetical protein IT558_00805 [Alphaproteobacteria bacterium]|nr:hypothetical protein [Alphaproteobacteria bacterium]
MTNLKVPALITLFVGIMLAGAFWAGTIKGSGSERVKCAEQKTKAIQEGIKAHEKRKKEIMSLPDPDLDQRLTKWLRD